MVTMTNKNQVSSCSCRCTFIEFLFSLLLINDVLAQSSCNSASRVQAPLSRHQGGVENFNSLTFDGINTLCKSGSFSSSSLQSGLWYSYVPSNNTISRIQVEQAAEGGTDLPNILSLKGPCDSLTCDDDVSTPVAFEDAEAGTEYFIYIFRNSSSSGDSPYTLVLDYISQPDNDNIENAVAITDQDLPFRGQYSTYGARSDASQDACGLSSQHGIWLSYSTSASEQPLILTATTDAQYDDIGIQSQNADGSFSCVTKTGSSGSSIEWTAQGNVQYYILVGVNAPEYGHLFLLTLQSSNTPAPVAATVSPNPPTLAPSSSSASSSATPASSSSSPSSTSLGAQNPTLRPTSQGAANAPTNVPTEFSNSNLPASSCESLPLPSAIWGTPLLLATMVFLCW